MNAVDTNVLVRYLTDDDLKQSPAARDLVRNNPIWISRTVLIETEWVLRSLYRFDREMIHEAFTNLAGVRTVEIEVMPSVVAALALFANGFDFADAIHVTGRPLSARFVTFDRALLRKARKAGIGAIAELQC